MTIRLAERQLETRFGTFKEILYYDGQLESIAICQANKGGSKIETEVRGIDEIFHKAFLMEDTVILADLLTSDFLWTHSTGNIQTKAVILANVRSGKTAYESIENDDVDVYLYKNAAVVSGLSTRRYPGKDIFWIRYSTFYVRSDGKWKAAAFHSSHVPDPKIPVK
jgi:hypothetical protein